MDVQFPPDVQARLDQLATETGRSQDEFVQDAMAGYFDELRQARQLLDRRYDEIEAGSPKLVSGDDVVARFRAKSAALGSRQS